MMISLALLLVSIIIVYNNSMFYSLSLLFISILTLYFILANSVISSLSALILVIVYVGAMIILVGYICAVTPNLYLEPEYNYLIFGLVFSSFSLFSLEFTSHFSKSSNLVDYFYSENGVFLFFFLILILFITLLIVTTHDNSPRGPFRSLI